ncbi:MAG: hypothetical protein QOI57_1979, partial [Rubrobacteraceae bacterium]|nr:hypothetical protein [Rubrobacteraceae bacterium]
MTEAEDTCGYHFLPICMRDFPRTSIALACCTLPAGRRRLLDEVNSSSTTDVDDGAPLGLSLGLPQYLVGDWSSVSLSEEDVAEQVHEGVAL